ncbi:DUF4337 domain-containing protein [Sphingomonas sp. A2-49]|uniref:DUF4337 domain-containing protein n=1 Tax=Sphingomonas sp. A2-49 TaxID=1391375 RepID=UPI0021D0EBF3|nr:DUF4337 domain-containing protein [Sphingomonas sp. A2-49]MCU6454649.1 DUF4337 domain-containing protein [Sphingomonas sp. A2-49]
MEFEVSAEAKDKRLNRRVAVTVVILSVAMGLGNIKDGNIVQAMDQAQARSVDLWNEYQATRTKLRMTEIAGLQLAAMRGTAASPRLATDAARYRSEAPRLAAAAQAQGARYDALNVHDDQFDASEASLATAISLCAVAALVESDALLVAAWAFAAFGLFLSACGFAGWGFHPDVLSTLLG